MTTGRKVVSVSGGFWFSMMGLLVSLLVVAMVEVSFFFFSFFFSAVVCGDERMWWLWMDVDVGGCGGFFLL